jgi:hypothetical protein
MTKTGFLILLLLLGATKEPLDTTIPTLDVTTSATPRYEPIRFASHDAHAARAETCTGCHHTSADDVKTHPKCESCHAPLVSASPKTMLDITSAFHKQCRTCHLAIHQENRTSYPPIKCLGCHTERK